MGNGQDLKIKNTGSSTIFSSQGNNKLNYMPHVPQIKKKLLSIARLTTDNNFIVEFNSHSVFV